MNLLDEYNKQEIVALIEQDEDTSYFLLELLTASSSGCCCCEAAYWCANACIFIQDCILCGSCNCLGNCITNCAIYQSCPK